MEAFRYAGSELDVCAEARNWKAYWCGWIRTFLSGNSTLSSVLMLLNSGIPQLMDSPADYGCFVGYREQHLKVVRDNIEVLEPAIQPFRERTA